MGQKRRWKRQCAYEECRAWARKGSEWCVAHPEGRKREMPGAPVENENARTHGMHSRLRQAHGSGDATGTPADDLRAEIAATRMALVEVMQEGLPASQLLKALDIGTAALTRLLRTSKQLDAAGADEVRDGLARALSDLGLAE